MCVVFANGLGDLDSIPGHVIPKTLKMVLDASLLNTQQYKVRIKSKVEQSRERSNTLPYTSVWSLLKREPSGRPRIRSPTSLTTYICVLICMCVFIYVSLSLYIYIFCMYHRLVGWFCFTAYKLFSGHLTCINCRVFWTGFSKIDKDKRWTHVPHSSPLIQPTNKRLLRPWQTTRNMYIKKYNLIFLFVNSEACVEQVSNRREFAHTEEPSGVGTACCNWLQSKFSILCSLKTPMRPTCNACSLLVRAYTYAFLVSSNYFVDFIYSWMYLSTASARFIAGQGDMLHFVDIKVNKGLLQL